MKFFFLHYVKFGTIVSTCNHKLSLCVCPCYVYIINTFTQLRVIGLNIHFLFNQLVHFFLTQVLLLLFMEIARVFGPSLQMMLTVLVMRRAFGTVPKMESLVMCAITVEMYQ